jgi:WD40 repeat protein
MSDNRILLHYGRLRDICFSPDGRVFLSTSNSNASGVGPFVDRIIELYDPTAVPEINKEQELSIYPNPAKEWVNISVNKPGNGTYELLDPLGRVMLTGTVNREQATISSSCLPKGLYYIKLVTATGEIYKGKIWKS